MPERTTRRRFVNRIGIGGASLIGIPYLLPQRAIGSSGANDVVNIALIGSGVRARQLVANLPAGCRIVAVCDVELPKAEALKEEIGADWKTYQDYRQLLDKEPVDGTVHCECDHNRVLSAIRACQASKDVYVEKPFSLYVTEGRALVTAVRRYNRICQTGTQARTIGMNQAALRMIREGKLGKLKSIVCRNYPSRDFYRGGPSQPIPAGLDWDMWCGQTELFPYNKAPHRSWGQYLTYAGGLVTFLGAQAYDMIQGALGTDETWPVEIWTTGPAGP
ncbi:MAG: Gfo/Idh/MocA family oxidoreductase, partial [Patescibacteria group bacterium]|nr:Gfo/Idh/MocA family oxidoreductase [Patescibacteria group bacterium]